MNFRSKTLLQAAKDQPCVLCGAVGTTIAAHGNGSRYGKGLGIKAHDFYTAWLCQRCHDQADGRQPHQDCYISAQEMWEHAFIKTVARWFELGIVEVKG